MLMSKINEIFLKCESLLTKRTPLANGYVPDYAGFSVPNKYVVGYAFDVNEHFRDMEAIKKYLLS